MTKTNELLYKKRKETTIFQRNLSIMECTVLSFREMFVLAPVKVETTFRVPQSVVASARLVLMDLLSCVTFEKLNFNPFTVSITQ